MNCTYYNYDYVIFTLQLFGDDSARMEKWVKKLFIYRQKAFLSNI